MPSACVEFERVSKSFGSTPALIEVSLEVPASRITAIVGESGSGKSTLLQHINGLLRPDSGEVRVFGRPVDHANIAAFRRRIGYAVQGVGLFPHLTAAENIGLLAQLAGRSQADIAQRTGELMQLMGLDDELAARFPHELSGGQQQRVGICRAMVLAPPLLLLDEPFSGVDPVTRAGLHERILALHRREPVSIVLVTHDMREAQHLASELAVMRGGRVLQSGSLRQVLDAPEHDYVLELMQEGAR